MRITVIATIMLLIATVDLTFISTASAGAAVATGPTSRATAGGEAAQAGGGGAAGGGQPNLSQYQGAADAVSAAIGKSTEQTKELLNSLMSSVKNDPGQLITKDMLQNLVRDNALKPQKAGTHSISLQSDQGFNGLSNYQPSGWVMTETVSGPVEKTPQTTDEKVPVYSYPKGVGPVLINSCTDPDLKEGSPCFASKEAGEGKVICPKILDGASYIGVGFDGRGFYKIESRRGSLVQRACANLASFSGKDVPDTMNVFGIYETTAETKSFQSADEYLSYIRDKAGLSDQKNLFISEASKQSQSKGFGFNLGAIGAIAGGAIGAKFGGPVGANMGASLGAAVGGAIGGGTASGSGSQSSTDTGKSNSQFQQTDQSKTQQGSSNNFFAVMYVNIIMYEITLDEVKPQDINLAVLKDYMSLPVSYYSVGADVKYQNFLLRWGTHYIRAGKFGGQLKITKTAKADKVSSAQEFASIAETEFQSMFSSLQSKYSQESSSWNVLGFGGQSNSASQSDTAKSDNQYKSTMNQESKLSQSFRQSQFTQTTVEAQGGTPEIAEALVDFYTPAFKQLYHRWIVSIKDYVKPFEFQLKAIDQLFNMNMDDLFPAGNLDFGCMGTSGTKVNILVEPETNRRYYIDERTSVNKKNKTRTKTVKIFCKYNTLEDFKTDLERRRISLEKAVGVYMVEGPFPTSTFQLNAGQPGCEQATLAQINLFSKGTQTLPFTELSRTPFLISFDLPQDIPNMLKSQAKYIMVYRDDRWFATEPTHQLIHLYDGCQLTGYKPEATKICFLNIILTYEEKTGFFHIDPLDFVASKHRNPVLPDWLSGSTVARASKLDTSGGSAAIQGTVPCNVKWLNSHRLDPSKNENCIHFTAASAGDLFVTFASIPRDHSTWYYLQINKDGVAFFKAMQLQKRDYQRGMGSLGDKNLYQSFFVCVNQTNGSVLMQYGKADPDSDVGTVYSGYKFSQDSQYSRLSFYSFGAGSNAVSLMDIRVTKQMPRVACLNTNYILKDGYCILDCHNECLDCNFAKDDHACFHCRNVRVESLKVAGEKNAKVVQCLPECPRGYELSEKNEKLCVPCTAGSFKSSIGNQKCVPCAPGSFSEAGAFECTICSPGTFSASAGATECKECAAGTSAKSNGSTSCTACGMGSFALAGKAECSLCSVGHFSNTTGQSSCQMCAVGFFAASEGMASCTPCPAGTSSAEGSRSCDNNCKKGEFSPSKGIACKKCPVGTFGPSSGSTSCPSCPTGSFQATEGQESCSTAPAGSYASGPGASSSTPCPAGSANPATGKSSASDCVPCASGSFSGVAGSTLCVKCPLGQYQPLTNQSVCLTASAGNYVDLIGQTAQKPCSPGSFSLNGASQCTQCNPGSFADQARSTRCHQCPAGTYSALGFPQCKDCERGSVSNAGASSCSKCSAGRFSDTVRSTSCQPCPAGSWSGVGFDHCKDCERGKFSKAEASLCSPCSAGRFSDRIRSADCHLCPAGFWSGVGFDHCKECPAGQHSNIGAASCSQCSAGSSSTPRASTCTLCPPGKFAEAGSPTCRDCPAGRYSNKVGSRNCDPCPGGTFSNTAAATGCQKCDLNFALVRRDGLAHCDNCPNDGATTNGGHGCLHLKVPAHCFAHPNQGIHCANAYDKHLNNHFAVPISYQLYFIFNPRINLRKIFIYKPPDCCSLESVNLLFLTDAGQSCSSDHIQFKTYKILDCVSNNVHKIGFINTNAPINLLSEFRFYAE